MRDLLISLLTHYFAAVGGAVAALVAISILMAGRDD